MKDLSSHPSLRVILTGATGMVGEGVLHSCLADERVAEVAVLTRRPTGEKHPKLTEVVVSDFMDLSGVEGDLTGYDACYFCAGVTSIGKSEQEYTRLTYTLTLSVATTLSGLNPRMVFCYVSGAGTDGTEKGKLMWARVKGKTENGLRKLPFRDVYLFRPGFLVASPDARRTLRVYRSFRWLIPLIRLLAPRRISTLDEMGRAMISVTCQGYEKPVLEVPDIKTASAS